MSRARGRAALHTLGERGCCEAATELCFDSTESTDRHLLQD